MSDISLQSLLVPSKETEIEFPGMDGWKLKICHLGRDLSSKLVKQATTTKIDKKTRSPVSEFDEDAFLPLFANEVVKGWTGLKLSYLEELLPVDLSGQDPDNELPFSQENAIMLIQNSSVFDEWLTEVVSDLTNFTNNK
tara:strand:- start:404 stop:820 length:417 start_codon:yes stop_codon:yes gene_type:complete